MSAVFSFSAVSWLLREMRPWAQIPNQPSPSANSKNSTTVINLTERRFRDYWKRTEPLASDPAGNIPPPIPRYRDNCPGINQPTECRFRSVLGCCGKYHHGGKSHRAPISGLLTAHRRPRSRNSGRTPDGIQKESWGPYRARPCIKSNQPPQCPAGPAKPLLGARNDDSKFLARTSRAGRCRGNVSQKTFRRRRLRSRTPSPRT
jgi:hypothetical protein